MMTLSKLYMDALLEAGVSKQRYGQALFNLLSKERPDLAEQVRGSDKDIFFMKGPADNFDQWDRFATFIESNWHKSPQVTQAVTLLAELVDFIGTGPLGSRHAEFMALKKKAVKFTMEATNGR